VSAGGWSAGSTSGPTSSPAVSRSAAWLQLRSRSRRSAALETVRSKAANASLSCAGVVMPAWYAPWNGTLLSKALAGASSLPIA
jgi:hypothetical protein